MLPFKPLVPEGRDASLELGMTDSLIMKLGSLRRVTVRPLSAVRRYTDLAQDAVKPDRNCAWNRCWKVTSKGCRIESG